MALGAQRRDVMKLVVGQGLVLTAIGMAIGLGAAFVLSRMIVSLLYDVTATDPLTFASVAGLMMFVALLACYFPALRATRIDPIVALRHD
jgi:ABC-type antimicrobial peptide transport system permease subunit